MPIPIDFLLSQKLSVATLDKLALLAGFQNWKDLKAALHGENSADLNYDDDDEVK